MRSADLYDIECSLLAALLMAFGLAWVVRRLGRSRPGFSIGAAIGVGLALRIGAVLGLSVTGLDTSLRGGDETGIVNGAREVAASSLGSSAWIPSESHRLHEIVLALQMKLGDFPETALRITQIAIAMLGIVLVLAAVYDLAGAHGARVGSWLLALEPAGILFNSILHREPLLVLASGLIVFGGSKVWAKLELRGVALMALGCAIATSTRPYAGWFLMSGSLLLVLHASMRQMGSQLRSLPSVYVVAIIAVVASPAVLKLTSQSSLEQNLQASQDANTSALAPVGGVNSNNLKLERVDFSTRSDLVRNLPRRIRDVILRPYPWQVQNTSQRLGAIGTLVVLIALYLLFRYARRNRGQVLAVTAPIIYPGFALLAGYALSVGNAGTGFRYRTHLVLLGLAALIVLREHALRGDTTMEASATDRLTGGTQTGATRGQGALGVARPSPLALDHEMRAGRKPVTATTKGARL
jgi:hypothetical protein